MCRYSPIYIKCTIIKISIDTIQCEGLASKRNPSVFNNCFQKYYNNFTTVMTRLCHCRIRLTLNSSFVDSSNKRFKIAVVFRLVKNTIRHFAKLKKLWQRMLCNFVTCALFTYQQECDALNISRTSYVIVIYS